MKPSKNIGLLIIPLPVIILGLVALYVLTSNLYLKNYGIESNAITREDNKRFSFTYEYTDQNNKLFKSSSSVDRSFYRMNMGAKTLKIKYGKTFSGFSIIENGYSNLTLFLISIFAFAFTAFGGYWMYHAVNIFLKLRKE